MEATEVVHRWIQAANEQNIALLLEYSDASIKLIGPRGSSIGHQALVDWVQQAKAKFYTLRVFARNKRVVVEQRGEWYSTEAGISSSDVASFFVLQQQRVSRVARYSTLSEALQEAGLNEADQQLKGDNHDHFSNTSSTTYSANHTQHCDCNTEGNSTGSSC